MRSPLHLVAAAALAISLCLLGGCAGVPANSDGFGTRPTTTATPAATSSGAPATSTAPAETVTAKIVTSRGEIVLALRPDKAPKTVANFVKLVGQHFYDGILVHRVVPGFVVQAGDPQTRGMAPKALRSVIARAEQGASLSSDPPIGTGGPGWTVPLEVSDLTHDRGVIAMARAQEPDTAGSQFYITLAPTHQLDGDYAVFGAVTGGMDVVDRLTVGDEIRSIRVVD